METKYKLYLFDLDGTLFDSDEILIVTFHKLYKLFRPGYNVSDEKILEFSGPKIVDTLANEFPNQDINFMLEQWRKYSRDNYKTYGKLFPGSLELLSKLKEKDIAFGVFTNKHRYATDYSFELTGLDKLGVFAICAEEVENLKPAPDGIYKAMEHFGIKDKKDVLYIGDTVFDYKAATNAGVDFGFVSWSPRKLPEGSKIDVLIESYSDFAKKF